VKAEQPISISPTGPRPLHPWGPVAATGRARLLPTEHEKLAKALWKVLRPHTDTIAYGVKGKYPGVVQRGRDELNRHFAFTYTRQIRQLNPEYEGIVGACEIPELTFRNIQEHLSGLKTLYIRSRWSDRMLVRIDIDCHDHEKDAPQIEEWVRALFEGGPLYGCDSPDGRSLYLWLPIPRGDEGTPTTNRKELNRKVQQLHDGLQGLYLEQGFARSKTNGKARIEVFGGYIIADHTPDDNGRTHDIHGIPFAPKRVIGTMITPVRCPTVNNMQDIEKLKNAIITLCMIERIIKLGAPAADGEKKLADEEKARCKALLAEDEDETPTPSTPTSTKPLIGPARRGKVTRHIVDRGEKLANARACISRTFQLLGLRTIEQRRERRAEALELALVLYDENGLGTGDRNTYRVKRFQGAMNFMLRTTNQKKAGKHTPSATSDADAWFDNDDLDAVQRRLVGQGAGTMVEQANARLRQKKQPLLTVEMLALAECTLVKNIVLSAGQCPTSAIAGFWKYFGLAGPKARVGSTIREAIGILVALDHVRPVMYPMPQHHRCRVWEVTMIEWYQWAFSAGEIARQMTMRPERTEHGAMAPRQDIVRGPTSGFFFTMYKDGMLPLDIDDVFSEGWEEVEFDGSADEIDDFEPEWAV